MCKPTETQPAETKVPASDAPTAVEESFISVIVSPADYTAGEPYETLSALSVILRKAASFYELRLTNGSTKFVPANRIVEIHVPKTVIRREVWLG